MGGKETNDDGRFFDLSFQRSYPACQNVEDMLCQRIFHRFKSGGGNEGIDQNGCTRLLEGLLTWPAPTADDGRLAIGQLVSTVYAVFDRDKDGVLDSEEFRQCFQRWIRTVLFPRWCLLIVDTQNDFIDGSLALRNAPAHQDGAEIVPVINGMLQRHSFDAVVYSMDWHPPNHCSFLHNVTKHTLHPSNKIKAENAKLFDTVIFSVDGEPMEQVLFPAHCVQGTTGAELHADLKIVDGANTPSTTVKKATDARIDCYSAFEDNLRKHRTMLDEFLKQQRITDVLICGLAYDYCVGRSAMDSLRFGYRTVIIEDAVRGSNDEAIARAKDAFTKEGGLIIAAAQLGDLMSGACRSPRLASQTLQNLLNKS
ncbi:uncharacterized protein LOC129593359 [Paramacrobiotus metropolitanus]|uniref:uncharacterized protein LOC129593359 n=1 Tax=Paramacrobiotus metropolitanus TaxID=2943436 RepID=UPI0024460C17|nr:uncharacterized protein LOC129593359 [Paramacrobiotus metropolitanus]